jgi:class 3 adenylate cyclase/CHASE2 domain-containing sensor protein
MSGPLPESERRTRWTFLGAARRRGLADDDPELAEYFERYLPVDEGAAWRKLYAEDQAFQAKALTVYPALRPKLRSAWDGAVRDAAGASDARRYGLWGIDYRRALIALIGHPEASIELGVVVAPWRAGWPKRLDREDGGEAFVTGIGTTIDIEDGGLELMSIMPGGPAARDGRLRTGDRIEAIAQGQGPFEETAGLALERVLPKIRGPKGSVVRLRVRRAAAGGARMFVVPLARDEVRLTDPDACAPPRAERPRPPLPRRGGGAAGAAAALACVLLAGAASLRAMKLKDPAALPAACAATLLIALFGLLGRDGWLRTIDARWTDALLRGRGPISGDSRITVVAIDDETLRKASVSPEVSLLAADRLFGYGARVVGYDIFYIDEPPYESARIVADATCRWGDRLVHSTMAARSAKGVEIREPFPALRRVSRALGVASQPLVDADGVLRVAPLAIGRGRPGDWAADPARKPSLALKLAEVYEGLPEDSYLAGGNLRAVNFRGRYRVLGASRVLDGTLTQEEREALRGGIALVGFTAAGRSGNVPTPLNAQAPAVLAVADVLDNLLDRRFLTEAPRWVDVSLTGAFAFAAAALMAAGPLASFAGAFALLAGGLAAAAALFHAGVFVHVAAPGASLLLAFGALYVERSRFEARERRRVKQTFGQFVAPAVVREIIKTGAKIELGGETRRMTVFFLDIEKFTTISEKIGTKDLIKLLNRCLNGFSARIHERSGVIDKYIGDSVMAFWNAPMEQPDHAHLACLAALDCQLEADKINAEMGALLPVPLHVRVGLATGEMTVGLMGSDVKMQYTVIGDEVNLASRLEGANKAFGSRILATEECFRQAGDDVVGRLLGRVRVVGKDTPIGCYDILSKKGELPERWQRALPLFQRAVLLFNSGMLEDARRGFQAVLEIIPEDGPSLFYLRELAENPPAPGWDGVFRLAAK